MTIEERISAVRESIAAACARSGRQESEIKLIAVTKTRTPEEINKAISCGIKDIGENRVQELCEKIEFIDKSANIHLIGALQTNKVKYIIDKVCMIHSLDRISLAEEIEKQAQKRQISPVKVLIEVNIAGEETKSGVLLNNLPDFLDILTNFRYINPVGLMTVAPAWADETMQAHCFEQMRKLLIKGQAVFGKSFSELSMGMSRDYFSAIEHGATMVRIGTSIFGERDYNGYAKQG